MLLCGSLLEFTFMANIKLTETHRRSMTALEMYELLSKLRRRNVEWKKDGSLRSLWKKGMTLIFLQSRPPIDALQIIKMYHIDANGSEGPITMRANMLYHFLPHEYIVTTEIIEPVAA